ncbi:hypothetical protein V1290_006086 [Bradyrhizobium sp. AZCC 1578]|uniref:Ig-like domain-containing protein n=1 Tax=Bradyrhizobium sp. AZCC 1578 TaxID=3117027 RepID=UPI002FF015E5
MATYDSIPLSWNDPLLSGVTSSSSVTLRDGGTLSYKSIVDNSGNPSVTTVGAGSFTIDHVRIDSREGIRLAGDGDVTISNSYIETAGIADDHADGIQAYAPGSTGNVTITNTTIVNPDNTAVGMFIADDYSGTFTFDNVVFQSGPFGLRIAADANDITVSLKDVYFVGPFMFDDFLFEEVNADIHITRWENVRSATIVNGELVPGELIPPPWPVEGGGSSPTSTTIDDFSNDSGAAGDGITNDSTLTLTGSAAANSTVKVFDGTTQIGTTTTNSSGAWSYTTAALSNGNHSLKATATTTSGTSSTSSVLAVKIDTVAPTAPTMATPTNNANGGLNLTGTAEANSVVKVFDGTAQIGTATANGSGVWNYTTGALAAGSHSLTARATDAAGNTGAASAVVTASTGTSAPPATPATPTIASFSNDTGAAGDGITSDNTLQLKGTAAANSTVKIYDGSTQIGTTTASSTGSWDYITSVLTNAKHVLTATATTSSGQTSAASGAVTVTVDTLAPTAPALSSNAIVNTNQVKLSGTAEANSTVTVYDGTTVVGTGTTNSTGAWSVTTNALSTGTHALTVKAADAAGNVSAASQSVSSVIGATAPPSTTTTIESDGSIKLVLVGDNYRLDGASGSGPSLKFGGADFVDGQFGAWAPIGAEKTATGYQVAWKDASTGLYTAWNTDNNGNYVSNVSGLTGHVSGTNYALKSLETSLHQDLNGDGQIGLVTTAVETQGSTALTHAADHYFLYDSGGSGPSLKYGGADFVDGQFGAWAPIGAEKTATGYQVTWKEASTGLYTAWNTDNNGNYVSNVSGLTGHVSGTNYALKSLETSLHQDLNGDGQIGLVTTAVETQGSTDLTHAGDHYFLYDSGGSGPSLKYGGADFVDGQFGAWAPIGAEKTATGYQVAWKDAGTGLYTAWNTDNNGNYVSNVSGLTGHVSGTNYALKSLETSLHQDLNGDGQIGASGAAGPLSAVALTTMYKNWSDIVTIKGVADANSQIKLYDGNTSIGKVTAAADGTWSFQTSSAVSDTLHTYTAKQIDSAGQVVGTSGSAILGSTGSNTLKSTSGNDILVGGGQSDTFAFAANFGRDVIKDFTASGSAQDTIQFSKTVFDSFASVLSHASQVGQDIVISSGSDTLTLKNTKLSSLSSQDFHFA